MKFIVDPLPYPHAVLNSELYGQDYLYGTITDTPPAWALKVEV